MTPDMYFLPLIANALHSSDPQKGLKEAFEEIERRGQYSEYHQGFKQFKVFMVETYRYIDDPITTDTEIKTLLQDLTLQIISGVIEENSQEEQCCLELFRSHPDWNKRFEKQCTEAEKANRRDRPVRLLIEKDGESFQSINVIQLSQIQTLKDITPGRYRFILETGRLIGDAELAKNELLWEYAFPKQDLKLAADTGDTVQRPTRTIKLLNGEVIIKAFPGIDSGRMEVEIR